MSKISERIKNVSTVTKDIMYLVGVVSLICGSVYFTIDSTLDKKMDFVVASVEQRVSVLEEYNHNEISRIVFKQESKILSGNFSDIKKEDIKFALEYYPTVQEPSKQLTVAYEIILRYYTENPSK